MTTHWKKKFVTGICGVVLALSAFSVAGAETENEFGDVQMTADILFSAEYDAETSAVHMAWSIKEGSPWKEEVMWYKIVRSQENPLPTFPEDESVAYAAETEGEGTDTSPLPGKTFYRLCAITYEKKRLCSNVVAVDTEQKGEEMPLCIQVITPAKNVETGACKDFPTPCDVPEGWEVLPNEEQCPKEEEIVLNAEKQGDIVHLTWKTKSTESYASLVLLRGPENSPLQSPFSAQVEVFPLDETSGKYDDITVLPKESYRYRICVPNGTACDVLSNIVSIAADVPVHSETPGNEQQEKNDMPDIVFSDVDTDSEMGKAILGYAAQGVVHGFDDGTFRPDKPITRAEIAKITILAKGETVETPHSERFCDVPVTEWFAPYVSFFVDHGYVNGFPSDACEAGAVFLPHKPVLRSEALKMIFLMFEQSVDIFEDFPVGFSDVPEYHWVVPYAKAAHELGIIDGETLRPDDMATRGEVMLMLTRIDALR